jgi:hypothetical protein
MNSRYDDGKSTILFAFESRQGFGCAREATIGGELALAGSFGLQNRPVIIMPEMTAWIMFHGVQDGLVSDSGLSKRDNFIGRRGRFGGCHVMVMMVMPRNMMVM